MYGFLLILHNLTRWLVLVAAVYALYVAYSGWFSRRAFTPSDRRANAIYGGVTGIQLLFGLLLYFWPSGLVLGTLTNGGMGAAMRNDETRFFVAEHLVGMIIGIALVHIGSGVARRAATDTGRFQRLAIFNTIATLIIIFSIPWWRPLLRI